MSGGADNMYRFLGVSAANMRAVGNFHLGKKFFKEDTSPEEERKLQKFMETL